MTMQWKFISTFTTDFIDDERFRHIKHTNMLSKRPKLLGSFRLEMQLNSRAPKDMYLSGRAEGLERNTKLFLSDAAFLSRQFTVIIEKGNFAAVTDYNTGGRRELRMTFDASPYPAREAYRVDRTSGPGLEDFYDWLSPDAVYQDGDAITAVVRFGSSHPSAPSHIKDPTTSNRSSSSTMCHINRTIWSCCKIEDTIVRCAHSSQFGTIIPQRCLRNFKVVKSESVSSLCSGCKGETDSDSTASVEAKVDVLVAAIGAVKTYSD
ncbi:uncharacterized protein MYCGRDRAFT_95032 [Zymoseptoria tritici IPO323]|uniref:Uncharacterized protein n=1 Tax=Zymoseptoria tritici (strain CBS 115943 / IPO323) TaxID=336722 RepID=F9XGY6_ZYMTI|nr:uncharacterized protein MYCGRDRAFT_95032 [Zymoseptoria tritici IPO323]EGP84936.1 hypothetical protein MYCGRDRAFT_95032 [Zymoseptoria tritici IPO323]